MPSQALANRKIEDFEGFDGTKIYFESYAAQQARAAVILLHGYAEHCGRYRHVIAPLWRAGCNVYTYDHRGHGKSGGARAYVRRFDDLLEDLDLVMARVREREGERPIFLIGHSMGAAVAALYVITRRPRLQGVVLSGLAVIPLSSVPAIVQKIGRLVAKVMPKFPAVKLDFAHLVSRDSKVVAAYLSDPLVYKGKLLARTGDEILLAGQRVLAEVDSIMLPLQILHGSDDQVAAIEGSRKVFEDCCSSDKDLREYKGHYHEVFNDIGNEQVIQDVVEWVSARA